MARMPGEREHADLRMLNARLSTSGDIKDAVALYNARKSSKR
jgi:phage terminase large subunit